MLNTLADKIKNLHPKKFIKISSFKAEGSGCSDCRECNYRCTYDWSWVNQEGYGTTVWAPTLSSSTRGFGMNDCCDDFLVTYLR